jgi:hypothetical protein
MLNLARAWPKCFAPAAPMAKPNIILLAFQADAAILNAARWSEDDAATVFSIDARRKPLAEKMTTRKSGFPAGGAPALSFAPGRTYIRRPAAT